LFTAIDNQVILHLHVRLGKTADTHKAAAHYHVILHHAVGGLVAEIDAAVCVVYHKVIPHEKCAARASNTVPCFEHRDTANRIRCFVQFPLWRPSKAKCPDGLSL